MQVESLVTFLVMCGVTDNKALVSEVQKKFNVENTFEQEMISEAIIYAKQGVLN
jgi:hypothetical protein